MKQLLFALIIFTAFPACRDCSGWVYEQEQPDGSAVILRSDILMKDRRFLPGFNDSTTIYISGYDLECELMLVDSL